MKRAENPSRQLHGATIVLTGASSGIGRATALALAQKGANLHLLARRASMLDDVCRQARARGGAAVAHVVDVRDEHQVRNTAERIAKSSGPVDVLVNNAGVGAVKSFLDTTNEDWDWTLDTNLKSVVYSVRAFLPQMLERGRGTIVNVASLAGLVGNPLAAYSASKFAVVGLSESLLIEYGACGIDVVVVCPGVIDTEIAAAAATAGRSTAAFDARMRRMMARFGVSPEAVARDIVSAIEEPKFLVLTPCHAGILRALHRVSPRYFRRLMRYFGAGG